MHRPDPAWPVLEEQMEKNTRTDDALKKKILIIEDEELLGKSLREALEIEYEATLARSGEEGLKVIGTSAPDLVLLDVRLPGIDGVETLRRIKEGHPAVIVIMMTAYGTMETIIETIKLGAFTFVKKPFKMGEIRHAVSRAFEEELLRRKNALLEERALRIRGFAEMVGAHPLMNNLYETIGKVAPSRGTTVLILGESGTGKELVARGIHSRSSRSDGPFVEINCAVLNHELLESELFGHERGAFTDARAAKKGLFEMAAGGTLFLDEIGELPVSLQVKLLKAIEDKRIRRLGGTTQISVDVRIIAATNRNLKALVASGDFREDLFFRLNVFPLEIPPLRQRKSDIPSLAHHYVDYFNTELGKSITGIAPETLELLGAHDWPGNVRELKNGIERAMILTVGPKLTNADFLLPASSSIPRERSTLPVIAAGTHPGSGNLMEVLKSIDENCIEIPEEGFDFEGVIGMVEKAIIQKALSMSRFNRTRASKLLGLTREILRCRIKKYELE